MALRSTTFLTLDLLKTWCKVTPGQSKTVSALVSTGRSATATVASHGYRHGDTVRIAGAVQTAYNGSFTISLVDGNTFSYTTDSTPSATTATGTITVVSDQDAILTILGDRVCAALERDTDRVFARRDNIEETRNGTDRNVLLLQRFPIIELDRLTIDGAVITADQYALEAARGAIRLKGGRFSKGVGNVYAEYSAGYDDDCLPADVIGTALDICKYYFDRITSNTVGANTISVGGSTVNITVGLPQDLRNDIKRLMNPRLIGVGAS